MIRPAILRSFRHAAASRGLTSKLGSLLLLFQRSPLVQMLLPEARVAGSAGLGELTKWTVRAVAGLGAFDSVTGATTIAQVIPDPGGGEVPATTGEFLNFLVQIAGTPSTDQVSWSVDGLPPGLTNNDLSDPSIHQISGIPTEEGETTVTVTAWEKPNQTGSSFSQEFLIVVAPAIIATQPASVAIANNTSTTLSVVGNANGGTLTYRWFRGTSGSGNAITGTAGAGPSYTTPLHSTANTPASYWVRVTRDGIVKNSNTATVTIATAPAITDQPDSTTIPSGGSAQLSVGVSGTAPSIQWYRGASGVTGDPVAGATTPVFITPPLTATTSFWARATNPAGSVDSNAAVVTVTADPFEEWRTAQFNAAQLANPAISGPGADPDGDGISNQDEHVFGTLPLVREASPLSITLTPGHPVSLAFTARLASGPGYAGKTRHYALESRTDLVAGTWTPIAGFENIAGNNQPVTHVGPAGPPRAFYQLRVWLTP
jgi:hypothetical protein